MPSEPSNLKSLEALLVGTKNVPAEQVESNEVRVEYEKLANGLHFLLWEKAALDVTRGSDGLLDIQYKNEESNALLLQHKVPLQTLLAQPTNSDLYEQGRLIKEERDHEVALKEELFVSIPSLDEGNDPFKQTANGWVNVEKNPNYIKSHDAIPLPEIQAIIPPQGSDFVNYSKAEDRHSELQKQIDYQKSEIRELKNGYKTKDVLHLNEKEVVQNAQEVMKGIYALLAKQFSDLNSDLPVDSKLIGIFSEQLGRDVIESIAKNDLRLSAKEAQELLPEYFAESLTNFLRVLQEEPEYSDKPNSDLPEVPKTRQAVQYYLNCKAEQTRPNSDPELSTWREGEALVSSTELVVTISQKVALAKDILSADSMPATTGLTYHSIAQFSHLFSSIEAAYKIIGNAQDLNLKNPTEYDVKMKVLEKALTDLYESHIEADQTVKDQLILLSQDNL